MVILRFLCANTFYITLCDIYLAIAVVSSVFGTVNKLSRSKDLGNNLTVLLLYSVMYGALTLV